jgi:hypothetical protein
VLPLLGHSTSKGSLLDGVDLPIGHHSSRPLVVVIIDRSRRRLVDPLLARSCSYRLVVIEGINKGTSKTSKTQEEESKL